MMDWTVISCDPNDKTAKSAVSEHLAALRIFHLNCEMIDVVLNSARGKRVLDVGVAAHTRRYIDSPEWRHRKIRDVAGYILGIDILGDLVEALRSEGFNVRTVDATSNVDLEERFDLIYIGDVIEHVDNPVDLLKFACKHLIDGGRNGAT